MKKYVVGYIDQSQSSLFSYLTVPKGKSWKILATMYEAQLVTSTSGTLFYRSYAVPHFYINGVFALPSQMPYFAQVKDTLTLSASVTLNFLVYLSGIGASQTYTDTASANHSDPSSSSSFGYTELLEDDALYTAVVGYTSSNSSGYLKYRYLIEELPLV